MANINHFKILQKMSIRSFEQLKNYSPKYNNITDNTQKARFGFYLLMLENITGVQDTSNILDMILDADFNNVLFDTRAKDSGIDAYYIEKNGGDDNTIHLFNFKYREKFNTDKEQSLNESILSTKFLNALSTENYDHLEGKVKQAAEEIIKLLHGDDIYKLQLHIISNENKTLRVNDNNDLINLKEIYDLEINPIGLNEISELLLVRPEIVNASLLLESDAVMSYREDEKNSNVSYILRLNLLDLVRITCRDKKLREMQLLDEKSSLELTNQDIDYGVLYDNVRGFVTKSKFNTGILTSLRKEPEKFFLYNNGITITAKSINAESLHAKKKYRITLSDFQVINGGQTLRTLHNFNKENPENRIKLASSEVLVRAFKFANDNERNKIAEYTNSQNAISNIDLRSIRTEQIELEKYLSEEGILYSRKKGDLGIDDKEYELKISMEKFGQILFSLTQPHQVSNKKKEIFGEYYDSIFDEKVLEIEKAPIYIRQYFEIEKEYTEYATKKSYKISDQKYFYILYIMHNFPKLSDMNQAIEKLEEVISNFTQPITESRKLIQVRFKEQLDRELKSYR
ncbi:TPA: AIPR family protein [Mannheimia haemolytica]